VPDGLDVDRPAVVGRAADAAGSKLDRLPSSAMERPPEMPDQAPQAFDRDDRPGVPTWLADHVGLGAAS
jgi:hypothetical protein